MGVDSADGAADPINPAALACMTREQLLEEVTGLRRAMHSRAVIEQAKGIVMAACGCGPDEAFDVLVTQSQHENRQLREVARELVAMHGRRPPQEVRRHRPPPRVVPASAPKLDARGTGPMSSDR